MAVAAPAKNSVRRIPRLQTVWRPHTRVRHWTDPDVYYDADLTMTEVVQALLRTAKKVSVFLHAMLDRKDQLLPNLRLISKTPVWPLDIHLHYLEHESVALLRDLDATIVLMEDGLAGKVTYYDLALKARDLATMAHSLRILATFLLNVQCTSQLSILAGEDFTSASGGEIDPGGWTVELNDLSFGLDDAYRLSVGRFFVFP